MTPRQRWIAVLNQDRLDRVAKGYRDADYRSRVYRFGADPALAGYTSVEQFEREYQ